MGLELDSFTDKLTITVQESHAAALSCWESRGTLLPYFVFIFKKYDNINRL